MKILYAFTVLFALVACGSSNIPRMDRLEGEFVWRGELFGLGETFRIERDSSFDFMWTQGLINGETHGTLVTVDGNLYAFSELQSDSSLFSLDIPPQMKQDFYELVIRDGQWDRLIGATCLSYNNGNFVEGKSSDDKGACRLDSMNIDSVVVKYGGYHDAILKIEKNRTPKSLIIGLKEGDPYHFFRRTLIRVVNRSTLEIETFGRIKIFKKEKNDT